MSRQQYMKEYLKKYYLLNRRRLLKQATQYRINNLQKIKADKAKYATTPKYKKRMLEKRIAKYGIDNLKPHFKEIRLNQDQLALARYLNRRLIYYMWIENNKGARANHLKKHYLLSKDKYLERQKDWRAKNEHKVQLQYKRSNQAQLKKHYGAWAPVMRATINLKRTLKNYPALNKPDIKGERT